MSDLSKTSGTSPPDMGEFPAHLFSQQMPLPGGALVFHEGGGHIRRLPRTRYTIAPELVAGFSHEQVYAQECRLKETGRWIIPNGGAEFTLRIADKKDEPEEKNPGLSPLLPGQECLLASRRNGFMDLDVIHVTDPDGTVHPEYKAFQIVRRQYRGLTADLKSDILAHDTNSGILWWEKGDWLCLMRHRVLSSEELNLASHHYAMLVISLLDRVVNKVETTSHRAKSKKLARAGLNRQQPADDGIQRITLYCPGHFTRADGGSGQGAPKRMHYRAEHVKMQPHGPRNTLRKQITVEAVWVNAEGLDAATLGTPIRHIKLTAGPT